MQAIYFRRGCRHESFKNSAFRMSYLLFTLPLLRRLKQILLRFFFRFRLGSLFLSFLGCFQALLPRGLVLRVSAFGRGRFGFT